MNTQEEKDIGPCITAACFVAMVLLLVGSWAFGVLG